MIRTGLLGATGRMGQHVQGGLGGEKDFQLAVAVGKGDALEPLLNCEVVIDFSLPDALSSYLDLALAGKKKLPALVTGTTGLDAATKKKLGLYAKRAAVLQATNFSIGVHYMTQILKAVTPKLHAFGFSTSIAETHHVHKKDKPSGTALTLQAAVQHPGVEPAPITSQRKGEVIGEHTVMFETEAEAIIFHHSARERSVFARGAVECARFVAGKKPGLYSLEDAFGEFKT